MQDITQYTAPATLPVIITQVDLEQATILLSDLNRKLDAITTEKEKVTKPLNEALKAERARFKPYEEQLSLAIASIKQAMSLFITVQEDTKAKAILALQQGEATALDTVAIIADNNAQGAKTEQGAVSFINVKAWKITDITKVPHTHLLPNEPLIRQAMKDGQPIAGIEYYMEKQIRNRR